jgi:hypothetical protein
MTKRLTARQLRLPDLRSIKQCVGKDNHALIAVLVAHNKFLVRHQATSGNWGWVIDDTGICSKTSLGYLTTDASGSRLEPYDY